MSRMTSLFASVQQASRRLAPPPGGSPPPPPPPPPGSPATTFNALYSEGWTAAGGTTYLAKPSQTKPSTKSANNATPSYTDQRFGTKIFRVTSVADAATTSQMMRHEYSRRQAFNADSTKFIAINTLGHWWLYDADTRVRLDGGCTRSPDGVGALGVGSGWWFNGDCEPFWHPTDPNKIWVTEQYGYGNIWYEFDIVSKTRTTLFDLNALLDAIGWTSAQYTSFLGEGRPSNDGRYWGLCVMGATTDAILGFIRYDKQTNTITGYIATTNKPNNITTSPSGAYVVPSWCTVDDLTTAECAARPINTTNGTRAYSNNFATFLQVNEYGHHGDTATDVYGNDVWTSVNYNSSKLPDVSDGYLYYRRLDTGVAYDLPVRVYSPATSGATHVSGCAFDRPGWVVNETYNGGNGTTWHDEVVSAIRLIPGATAAADVRRLAHHQSYQTNDYFSEPHATVNRDFTRVMYASSFNATSSVINESYMIGLPSTALD